MNKKGFSLMEIMIAVVIVGILAAVAIPAYTGYMTRARRAEAITALETVALQEEKNFAERNSYDTIANLIARGFQNPNADANRNYDVNVDVRGGGTGFVAEARPRAGGQQNGDLVFAIDNNGNRGTLNGADIASGSVAVDAQLWNSLR